MIKFAFSLFSVKLLNALICAILLFSQQSKMEPELKSLIYSSYFISKVRILISNQQEEALNSKIPKGDVINKTEGIILYFLSSRNAISKITASNGI